MLYLDPRVHLDEVMLSRLVNKEFYRSGASVVYSVSDLQRILADIFSLLI